MPQKIIVELQKQWGKEKETFNVNEFFSVNFSSRSYKFSFIIKKKDSKYVLRSSLYRTDKIVWQLINKNGKITQTKVYNFKKMINEDSLVQVDHQKATVAMMKKLDKILLKYKGK